MTAGLRVRAPGGDGAPRPRFSARSGLGRVIGISASLLSTQAVTSILGLAFWTLAARTYVAGDVGVAGAAVATMMLLGSLGSLGLGTLLIARLPHTPQAERRVLVRTSLLAAGTCGAVLSLGVTLVAVHVVGADNLRPLVATPLAAAGLAAGTGLMSVVLVLDQAVLTIGNGGLQLQRNVVASVVKVLALVGLGLAGAGGGMAIFLAWTIGTAVSLPLVSWRTRGGRVQQGSSALVDLRMLRGLGRLAASHHALNISLQASLQLLPIVVTVLLTARDNAYFQSSIQVTGFVFALPYAVAIGLFAAAEGDTRALVQRMSRTIPLALGVSALAYLTLFPLAGLILGVFGEEYAAEGTSTLRILALAGLAFVIKDHYIALRRVQDRTTAAVAVTSVFLVLELVAAAWGASVGGTVGLTAAWVGVLYVEAVILAVPLWRARQEAAGEEDAGRHRVGRHRAPDGDPTDGDPAGSGTDDGDPSEAPTAPLPALTPSPRVAGDRAATADTVVLPVVPGEPWPVLDAHDLRPGTPGHDRPAGAPRRAADTRRFEPGG